MNDDDDDDGDDDYEIEKWILHVSSRKDARRAIYDAKNRNEGGFFRSSRLVVLRSTQR